MFLLYICIQTTGLAGRGNWNITTMDGTKANYQGPMFRRRAPDESDPSQWTVIPADGEHEFTCNPGSYFGDEATWSGNKVQIEIYIGGASVKSNVWRGLD